MTVQDRLFNEYNDAKRACEDPKEYHITDTLVRALGLSKRDISTFSSNVYPEGKYSDFRRNCVSISSASRI